MDHPRTDSARAHDDSDLIENIESSGGQSDSSGGNLARDVASQDELTQVTEPGAGTRVQKGDAIEHGTEVRPDRARNADG